jgi:osmotically-inducible protein OsmY
MPTVAKPETISDIDIVINREVKRKMRADIEVPDDRITVKVVKGVVTIEGTVLSESQKAAAERCVRSARNVRRVVNHITIESASQPPLEG